MTSNTHRSESTRVAVRGLKKSFGSTRSLNKIDLDINRGEILGLVGPNGAGKSTLIKILDGVYERDAGSIELDGVPVRSLRGIQEVAFIHQDLGLIDDLSISANFQLGRRPMRWLGPLLNLDAEARVATEMLSRLGIKRSAATPVVELSPGEKTLVAIARAMSANATIIFVDEATSTLPTEEARTVIEALRRAAAQGAAIVLVSHKLNEVLHNADRVVVLIDGEVRADRSAEGMVERDLVQLLVGHALAEHVEVEGQPPGETLFAVSHGRIGTCHDLTLTVRRGEVVGLTGSSGSGMYEVAHLVSGFSRAEGGEVDAQPGLRRAFLPPHRETQGGFRDLTGRENLMIASLRRMRSRFGLLSDKAEQSACREIFDHLDVRPADPELAFGGLSGGNQQKVILGRLLLQDPDLLVLCEPTRGVDVATRHEIYQMIRDLRLAGKGVLVVSSDVEDVFAVCDRAGVVTDGVSTDPVPLGEVSDATKEAMT